MAVDTNPRPFSEGSGVGVGALSHAFPSERLYPVHFSTEPGAVGAPGTGLNAESICDPDEVSGDEYVVRLPGTNDQLLDEDGINCGSGQQAFPLGLSVGDNLNAVDNPAYSWLPTDLQFPIFFSLDAASPSLAMLPGRMGGPVGPADILISFNHDDLENESNNEGGRTVSVFASSENLGLHPADELDALEMLIDFELDRQDARFVWPTREFGEITGDVVLFSLKAGSPTLAALGYSEADILTPNKTSPGGPPMLAWPARQSGLASSDDMNALKGRPEFLWRRAPHPDPTDTPEPSDCTLTPLNLYNGAWQELAPLPIGREGGYATIIGGRIYVGHGNSVFGDDNFNYVYNPVTDTWHDAASAPIPRAETTGVCAVDGDGQGKAYVVGGRDHNANGGAGGVLNDLIAYNPVTNAWERKASMPTPRAGLGAATVPNWTSSGGDAIFAIGGRTGTGPHSGEKLTVVEVYDVLNDTWIGTRAPLPIPMTDIYSTVYVPERGEEGSIFVIGGFGPNSDGFEDVSPAVQIYDVASNTWNAGPPMPTPRSNLLAGICNNQIHAIGGFNGFDEYNINEALDLTTMTWTMGWARMPTPISEFMTQGIYTGAEIFAIGEGIFGQGGQEHAVYTCGQDDGNAQEPNITIRPQEVYIAVPVGPGSPDGEATATVEIRNNGGAELRVAAITQSSDGGSPETRPWLTLFDVPAGELILPPGHHFNLSMEVDCFDAHDAHNTHYIGIWSNDPNRSFIPLPVTLVCGEPERFEDITVDPLDHEQTHPTTGSETGGSFEVSIKNEPEAGAELWVNYIDEADQSREIADVAWLDLSGLPTLPFVLDPHEDMHFSVHMDCEGLEAGTNVAHVKIRSSDPDEPVIHVRVVLRCVEEEELVPDIEVDPTTIEQVLQVPPGDPVSDWEDVSVRNLGLSDLTVTAIEVWETQDTEGDVSWLSLSDLPSLPLTLESGELREFKVTNDCTELDLATYTAYIKISSDDPEDDPIWVSVTLVCEKARTVYISLLPAETDAVVGETFSLNIVVHAADPAQQVAAVDSFVDFDTSMATVDQIVPDTSTLPVTLNNSVDNEVGQADYSGVTFSTAPSGIFRIATVEATCLAEGTIEFSFSTEGTRTTEAALAGESVLGNTFGATVECDIDAPLKLDPLDTVSFAGGTFTLGLWVTAADSDSVSAVDAFINFDSGLLQVVDADESRDGVQISPDFSELDMSLANAANNEAGEITFNTNKLVGPFPAGTFRIAEITFRVNEGIDFESLADEITAAIEFSFESPRQSVVAFEGDAVPGASQNATVTIKSGLLVTGTVKLQGGSRDWEGYEIPYVLNVFPCDTTFGAGTGFSTDIAALLATPTVNIENISTATKTVTFTFVLPLTAGGYDFTLSSPHTLTNVTRCGQLTGSDDTVDFDTLLEGDSNDDGIINAIDFSILAGSFLKADGDEAFDERADFDRTGIVNALDFSLLAANFLRPSPIEVPQ
ncbi:MAG: N-acetylneuraminic acid mutarotase [Chloroflexi bacterium]|nr:MAG: N-acetylneuraminic acid mutarotase [Chloroflexota bacterium]